jgi:hypothetical protein
MAKETIPTLKPEQSLCCSFWFGLPVDFQKEASTFRTPIYCPKCGHVYYYSGTKPKPGEKNVSETKQAEWPKGKNVHVPKYKEDNRQKQKQLKRVILSRKKKFTF